VTELPNLWAEVMGYPNGTISYHAAGSTPMTLFQPLGSPDVDPAHEIFRGDPRSMGLTDEGMVEFFHNIQRSSVYAGDALTCKRVDDQIACFLPTTTNMMVSAMPKSDADRLASPVYKPTADEIKQDLKLTHTVYKGNGDGACQRSIEQYVPLMEPTSKATHVFWMSMCDQGAIGNYMASSLAHLLLKFTQHGKDAVILKTGFYKCPQRLTGADPSGTTGMHVVSWMLIRVHSTQLDGTQFTQDIRIDILNRSAVADLRGAHQQSIDEGYADIHNRVTGPSRA
jgi:hypothetical protein